MTEMLDLKQRRNKAAARLQAMLVTPDGAPRRQLTPEEKADFDLCSTQIGAISAVIEASASSKPATVSTDQLVDDFAETEEPKSRLDLHQERGEAHAAMRALVYKADGTRKPTLTQAQLATYNQHKARVQAIDSELAARDAKLQELAASADSVDASANLDGSEPFGLYRSTSRHRQVKGSGDLFQSRDGQVTAALRPGERLAHTRSTGRQGEDFQLGAALAYRLYGYEARLSATTRASLQTGVGPGGGFLAPMYYSDSVIDLAREASVVNRAGLQTLNVEHGAVSFAVVKSDPKPKWRGELEQIAISEPAFGFVTLQARSLACIVPVSLELLAESSNIDNLLRNQLAAGFASEIDRVALLGSGIGSEPQGILNSNVPTKEVDGPFHFDVPVSAYYAARAQNATGQITSIFSWTQAEKLDALKDSDSNPLRPPEAWGQISKLPTNVMLDTTVVTGQFADMTFAVRQSLVSDTSGSVSPAFETAQMYFRAILRCDFVIIRPKSFVVSTGLTV